MLLPLGDDGVAGVVASLRAHDHVDLVGEEVDHLALALVSPLAAHQDGHAHSGAKGYRTGRSNFGFAEPDGGDNPVAGIAGKEHKTMENTGPLAALTESLPPEWKWVALFQAPEGYEREWRAWLAQAGHQEDLAVLRYWAQRADQAA